MREDDDDLIDIDEVCVLLGGSRPIDRSTVWRGIKAGRFSKPIHISKQIRRWRRGAVKRDIAALDNAD